VFILLKAWKVGLEVKGSPSCKQKRLLWFCFEVEKMQESENTFLKTSVPSVYRACKNGLKSKAVIANVLRLYTCKINLHRPLKVWVKGPAMHL
jgi:hypothetical protein